jgi:antitoxin component YwqK of YwqJK toxin-antitoxin module
MNAIDRLNAIENGWIPIVFKKILNHGRIEYRNKNNKLHSEYDLPAVIYTDGTQYWYKNGKLHRENDLPAKIYSNGSMEWYKNGKRHRDNDLPAVILNSGHQYWYKHGKLINGTN